MENRKQILINIAISLIAFVLIFCLNLAKSGGDIAIVIMSILFCFTQLLFILIYGLITKKVNFKLMIIIILLQVVELIFFFTLGDKINKYYKINYLKNETSLIINNKSKSELRQFYKVV